MTQNLQDPEKFFQAMTGAYGRKNRQMREKMAELPLFDTCRDSWIPGNMRINDKIVHTLIPKLVPILSEVYRFNPARAVITDAIRGDLCGSYSPDQRIIRLRKGLFNDSFSSFFRTFLHEQMHCLQKDMMLRYEFQGLRGVSQDEVYVIQCWLDEEAHRNNPAYYGRSVRELHARWVAESVIPED